MIKKGLIIGVGLLLISSLVSAGENLLPWGSFETKGNWSLWAPEGKTATTFTIDKTIHKEGEASAKITAADINDRGVLYTGFSMKELKTYEVSLWYKTENLIPDSGSLKLNFNFNLKDKGNGSAGVKIIPFPAGDKNTDWKKFTATVTTPPGTFSCQFAIDCSGTVGTVWFDGVTILEQAEEKNQVSIFKTDTPVVIDGKDNDQCWQKAEEMTNFLVADYEGNPVAKQTRVKVAYDAQNLYVFYKCLEPKTEYLTAKVKERDGAVFNDDCVELFISPAYGKTYQLGVNPAGALYDSEISVNDQAMAGYVTNTAYDSHAVVKSFIGPDYWSAEISLPLKSLSSVPVVNTSWQINFAREDKISALDSTYSRLIGGFYQPGRFSAISFTGDSAVLTRKFKMDFTNPLAIERAAPLYKELLTDKPGNYTTYMWNHNMQKNTLPKDMQAKFSDEEWKKEVIAQFEELGQAGMMGEPLPWANEENCLEYYQKYGMKRKCCTESSVAIGVAIRNGAEILNKKDVEEKGATPQVSYVDPAYVDGVVNEIIKDANKYKDKPYLGTIEGADEPSIPGIQGKISEMGPKMKGWNDEVLNGYGFGKYAMPAPNDPSYWQHPETHPFQAIAFNRWMSDKYAGTKKQMYEALKNTAPNLQYQGNDFWFMSGFIPYDFSVFGRYTDLISGDPYASSAERREGRGIYNHGFGTKFLKDLSGKPTVTVVQAFDYAGYTPKPDDLREWVSQALKNGASRIEFYESSERYNHPALYKEMLRLSKIVTSMKSVNLPKDADTAIICSLDSEAAESANGDQIYTAYSILGEKIGSWSDFISDRQLGRGEKDLSQYKIAYLPLATYMEKSVVEKIVKYVKNGGILIIGDPEAFSYNIDGSSLSGYREELSGTRLGKDTFKADEIKITSLKELNNQVFPILKKDSTYEKIHLAHSLSLLSPKVSVIARFANGKEAVLENNYGKGKVIYFAANPFAPDVVLIDSKIKEFFKVVQENAGAKTGRDIWKFLLPKE